MSRLWNLTANQFLRLTQSRRILYFLQQQEKEAKNIFVFTLVATAGLAKLKLVL